MSSQKYKMASKKDKTHSGEVIHIRLNQEEATNAIRGILIAEMDSLNVAKRIGRYHSLRMEELNVKAKLYGKMKETKLNIRKLQEILPIPKIPKILHKKHQEKVESEKEPTIESYKDTDIESQLREIQNRLEGLQRERI